MDPRINVVTTGHVRIDDVEITGNSKTKEDFIRHFVKPVEQAATFGDALAASNVAASDLWRLGIFADVDVHLQDSPKPDVGTVTPVDVKIVVKERDWKPMIRIGGNFGNQGGDFEAKCQFRNVLGRAETLSASFSVLQNASTIGLLAFHKPLLLYGPDRSLDVELSKTQFNQQKLSNYTEGVLGGLVRYSHGRHELAYEAAWREVLPTAAATLPIRYSAGDSLKSALRWTYKLDTRDSAALPTAGYYFSTTKEFAGLGGDARFFKSESSLQLNAPVRNTGWALNFVAGTGFLVPWGGYTSRINDRLFLGGPTTLRGFQIRGLGPRTATEGLGGDLYWKGGVHLTTPGLFFSSPMSPITLKAQLFSNFGNLVAMVPGGVHANARELFSADRLRASVGVGLVAGVGAFGRVELNYSVPYRTFENDRVNNWQLGISLQLM